MGVGGGLAECVALLSVWEGRGPGRAGRGRGVARSGRFIISNCPTDAHPAAGTFGTQLFKALLILEGKVFTFKRDHTDE